MRDVKTCYEPVARDEPQYGKPPLNSRELEDAMKAAMARARAKGSSGDPTLGGRTVGKGFARDPRRGGDAPIGCQPAANWRHPREGDHGKSEMSLEKTMSGILAAAMRGARLGAGDVVKTRQALKGDYPRSDAEQDPAAAPLQWRDLLTPDSSFAPKAAFQISRFWPTIGGGVVGGALGTIAAGGPENPVSWITALVGGSFGAGMMNALQTFGNYFAEELQKAPKGADGAYAPKDADAAYDRALERAAVSGVFSGVAWSAFPVRLFHGWFKNMMFEAFGLQPGVSMVHQTTDNALSRRPIGEGLGAAYTHGALMTATVAAGHRLVPTAAKALTLTDMAQGRVRNDVMGITYVADPFRGVPNITDLLSRDMRKGVIQPESLGDGRMRFTYWPDRTDPMFYGVDLIEATGVVEVYFDTMPSNYMGNKGFIIGDMPNPVPIRDMPWDRAVEIIISDGVITGATDQTHLRAAAAAVAHNLNDFAQTQYISVLFLPREDMQSGVQSFKCAWTMFEPVE